MNFEIFKNRIFHIISSLLILAAGITWMAIHFTQHKEKPVKNENGGVLPSFFTGAINSVQSTLSKKELTGVDVSNIKSASELEKVLGIPSLNGFGLSSDPQVRFSIQGALKIPEVSFNSEIGRMTLYIDTLQESSDEPETIYQ